MKSNSLKKISLFLFSCLFYSLFNVPLVGAEPPDKEFTKTIFSGDTVKNIQGALQSDEVLPVVQAIAKARDMASSYDVKFSLNERFKAFLSLGRPYVEDMAGRQDSHNQHYNARFGFLITLQ